MNIGQINTLKGIHPGIFLENELKKRKIAKSRFAISIGAYPQTLGSITKGKRDMNTSLALKIEHALNIEEGFFMILQVYYDIKEIKQSEHNEIRPELSKFRKAIFWDTRIENIDWVDQKEAIIKRVFERGNQSEKDEIIKFYGKQETEEILQSLGIPLC